MESLVDIKDYQKKIDESVLPIRQLLGNKNILENQLKNLEFISQDLDHYIEFNKLNVASAYWVYKIRKTVREKGGQLKKNYII